MALHDNLDKLKDFIRKALIRSGHDDPSEVSIDHYNDKDGGLRISEISVMYVRPEGAMCGASWMHSDFEAASLLFFADRFLEDCEIKPYRPEGWDGNIDIAQETEQNLYKALTGAYPEWEERPTDHPIAPVETASNG